MYYIIDKDYSISLSYGFKIDGTILEQNKIFVLFKKFL